MQWTNEDPGAGDLHTLRDAQRWFSDASAFSSSMLDLLKNLADSKEVTDEVSAAFTAYIDEVEEIRERSKGLILDRDTALVLMNVEYMDSTSSPPDAGEVERRQTSYSNANDELRVALTGLKRLAQRRQNADYALAQSALGSISDAWGELKGLPSRIGIEDPKASGNRQAWEVFGQFVSGEGPRDRFFTDGDPITE